MYAVQSPEEQLAEEFKLRGIKPHSTMPVNSQGYSTVILAVGVYVDCVVRDKVIAMFTLTVARGCEIPPSWSMQSFVEALQAVKERNGLDIGTLYMQGAKSMI